MFDLKRHWLRFKEWALPARKIARISSGTLPKVLPSRDLLLLCENDEMWSVAMSCPCGCRQRVELPLIPEAKPHWRLITDDHRRPTLHPSVWLLEGCRSHFFIRSGKIDWIQSD